MAKVCVFCAVIAGDAPAEVVYADGELVAFLDHKPVFRGHVLLVPREHVVRLRDLPDERVGAFFSTAQRLERAVEDGLEADGSMVLINNVVSQSVPHLHLHVVPRTKGDGLRGFFWPRQKYRDEAHAEETQQALRDAVESLRR